MSSSTSISPGRSAVSAAMDALAVAAATDVADAFKKKKGGYRAAMEKAKGPDGELLKDKIGVLVIPHGCDDYKLLYKFARHELWVVLRKTMDIALDSVKLSSVEGAVKAMLSDRCGNLDGYKGERGGTKGTWEEFYERVSVQFDAFAKFDATKSKLEPEVQPQTQPEPQPEPEPELQALESPRRKRMRKTETATETATADTPQQQEQPQQMEEVAFVPEPVPEPLVEPTPDPTPDPTPTATPKAESPKARVDKIKDAVQETKVTFMALQAALDDERRRSSELAALVEKERERVAETEAALKRVTTDLMRAEAQTTASDPDAKFTEEVAMQIQRDLTEAKSQLSVMRQRFLDEQAALSKAQTQLAKAQTDVKNTQTQLAELRAAHDMAVRQLSQFKADYHLASDERDQMRKQFNEQAGVIKDRDVLRQVVDEMSKQIDGLKADVYSAGVSKHTAEERYNAERNEVVRLQRIVKQLEAQNADVSKEHARLVKQLEDRTADIAKEQERYVASQQEVQHMRATLASKTLAPEYVAAVRAWVQREKQFKAQRDLLGPDNSTGPARASNTIRSMRESLQWYHTVTLQGKVVSTQDRQKLDEQARYLAIVDSYAQVPIKVIGIADGLVKKIADLEFNYTIALSVQVFPNINPDHLPVEYAAALDNIFIIVNGAISALLVRR